MLRKGIDLKGSWHYNMKGALAIMGVIARNREKLDRFITHQYPIDEIQRAWETQVSGECAKVVIQPWA